MTKPNMSSYATFGNNPIYYADPQGNSEWHPEDDGTGTGNQKLVADEGDNAETLKTYLNGIGTKYTDEEFTNWSNQISNTTSTENCGITDVELTSTSGQFNNLMGQYLMTQYENDKSWGYMDLNGAWSCSPTLAKRTKLAAKFVYGENSEQYQKLDRSTPEGSVGYNQFQNNFNFTEKGNAYYKKANAEGYGLTTEMRKRSVAGALQYANLLGEYVETKDIWSNLKPGAVLGLSYHTAIFVKYAYKNGEVHGMYIWDDHNEERIIYKGGQPPARIGGNFK